MAVIPNYNKVDFKNDTKSVVGAKIAKNTQIQQVNNAIQKAQMPTTVFSNGLSAVSSSNLGQGLSLVSGDFASRASQAGDIASKAQAALNVKNELAEEFQKTAGTNKIESAVHDVNGQMTKNLDAVTNKQTEMENTANNALASATGIGGSLSAKKPNILDKAGSAIKDAMGGTVGKVLSTVAGGVIASKVMGKVGGKLGGGALGGIATAIGTGVLTNSLSKGIQGAMTGQKVFSTGKSATKNKAGANADKVKQGIEGVKQATDGKVKSTTQTAKPISDNNKKNDTKTVIRAK